MISLLSSNSEDFDTQLSSLIAWEANSNEEINNTVRKIIKQVKDNGDSSVLRFTSEFDSLNAKSISELIISKESLKKSFNNLNQKQKDALNIAAQRIESYHLKQKQESWNYTEDDGTVLGQKVSPLDRVGLYVPGGKAAYPSSVLMNSIPAKVAGVNELIMVVPTPKEFPMNWYWQQPILQKSTWLLLLVELKQLQHLPMELKPFQKLIR